MFDLALVLALGGPAVVTATLVAVILLAMQGRPIFFVSERMRSPDHGFALLKFRTMTGAGIGVSGGHVDQRVTLPGRVLRRTRLDELPQLWNILRGEMSFVGPRPPLRRIVDQAPQVYAQVLRSRPGLTGLASLRFHRREARILAACGSPDEAEDLYLRRCVGPKARLDLIYQKRASLALDCAILFWTILDQFRPQVGRGVGRRGPRPGTT
jgi:lipopolysaccharide/colanic/teichoic acid biosynthesis glycosyltransferase